MRGSRSAASRRPTRPATRVRAGPGDRRWVISPGRSASKSSTASEPGDGAAPLTDAELSAWLDFLNAHTDLTRRLDSELEAGHQISLAEHTVLLQLVMSGGHLRMSELADSVLLSPSGVSRLVDRLVGDGLLERRPCGGDGRAVYAAITERGRALLREAEPTYSSVLRRLFVGQYTQEEYARLATLLLRVAPACRRLRAPTDEPG